MKEKRKKDRRKKQKPVMEERRSGPRRITCDCGGKIDVVTTKVSYKYVCLRCGRTF
jgi:hypothetical protein